jgi:hypothetical protein
MSEIALERLFLIALTIVQLLAVWDRVSDQKGWVIPSVFLALAVGCGVAAIAVRPL